MSTEPPTPRTPTPLRIGGGWTFLYAALAVAFLATAVYLVAMRQVALTDPQVLVSGLGAVWFLARAALNLRKKPG